MKANADICCEHIISMPNIFLLPARNFNTLSEVLSPQTHVALTHLIPIVHLIHILAHTHSTSTHIVFGEHVSFAVQQQLHHGSFVPFGHISFDHGHKGTASILRQRWM